MFSGLADFGVNFWVEGLVCDGSSMQTPPASAAAGVPPGLAAALVLYCLRISENFMAEMFLHAQSTSLVSCIICKLRCASDLASPSLE